jgi:hypothetical protein
MTAIEALLAAAGDEKSPLSSIPKKEPRQGGADEFICCRGGQGSKGTNTTLSASARRLHGDRASCRAGRPRRNRRRARICRARADGRRLMNERDPTKDRRRRRFTPADIRQIRHHAPQCGLACWASREYPATSAARIAARRQTEGMFRPAFCWLNQIYCETRGGPSAIGPTRGPQPPPLP